MKRREQREPIFKLLFRSEFNEADQMDEQIAMYMDDIPMLEERDRSYIVDKYQRVISRLSFIDGKLDELSQGWKVRRMGKVELSILRLAAYEICFDGDVPTGVAINEAVELGKLYGGDDAPSFINGILGKLAREQESSKSAAHSGSRPEGEHAGGDAQEEAKRADS